MGDTRSTTNEQRGLAGATNIDFKRGSTVIGRVPRKPPPQRVSTPVRSATPAAPQKPPSAAPTATPQRSVPTGGPPRPPANQTPPAPPARPAPPAAPLNARGTGTNNSPSPSPVTRGLDVQHFTPPADNELFAELLAAEIFWDDDLVRFAGGKLLRLDEEDLAILRKYGYTEKISGSTALEQAGTLIDDFQRAAARWRAAGGNNYLNTAVIGNGYQGKPIRNLLDQQERDRQQFLAVLDAIRGSNLGLGALGYAVDGEQGALFWGAVGDLLSPIFQGIGDKAHYDELARQAHGPQSRQEIHGKKDPTGRLEREEPAKSTPEVRKTTTESKGLATPAPAKPKAPTAQGAPKAQTPPTANAPKQLPEPAIPAKPTWFIKQVGNLRLRAKSWFADVYVGTSTGAFRDGVLKFLQADKTSELARALLENGEFVERPAGYTMDDLERDPRIWEAGHVLSEKEGGRDVIVIQSAYLNQRRGHDGERFGGIVSDFALVIDGIAIDPLTAVALVKAGRLKESTVRNATVLRWE